MQRADRKKLKVLVGPKLDGSGHVVRYVRNLEEASKAVRQFIDANDIGASQWYAGDSGYVYAYSATAGAHNMIVAKVSYNGRVWNPDGETEIKL